MEAEGRLEEESGRTAGLERAGAQLAGEAREREAALERARGEAANLERRAWLAEQLAQ